ncbi:MAG: ABC transporter ATP-binding protein [Candidatus Melainabacteria bacterium]|nr:MAG: ABC transporter ATP-binding protein [Candidatus Melainabacteria bacterium]
MTTAFRSPSTPPSPEPPEQSVIYARGLKKTYGNLEAIKGIDLSVQRGEVFGLIGPDGAGKTSTFHILGGVMEPSGGEVRVIGKTPREARLGIGYLTQQFSLFLDMSIEENMRYVAGLREVPEDQFKERKEKSLKQMNLYQFRDRLAGQLSGGMKQKLALCCALIARPTVLLLDEPTTGVDPVSRREFWDLLAEVAADGVTIAVATPYLDEAERCGRVALMYEGTIYQLGTVSELKQNLHLSRLEVRSGKILSLENELVAALKENRPKIADVQTFGDRLDVLVPQLEEGEHLVRDIAGRFKLDDITIVREEPTLENVFVTSLKHSGDEENYMPFAFTKKQLGALGASAIKAERVTKIFGTFHAVEEVSLDVAYGQVYGLLGANGAGKTTTIKMLCGLLEPTRGQMMLAGQVGALRDPTIRERIGYMSQKFTLYDDLTLFENLQFYCGVYEIPIGQRLDKIKWVLRSAELERQGSMLTAKLPGGWKQRLAFGACVMHEPEILFLDEPTSGVDPLARRDLWTMISDFARHGSAILVTTHFLEEAEHCHELGFMVSGKLVAHGSPSEIKASQPGQIIEIITNDNQRASNLLKKAMDNWRVSIFADRLHVVLDDPAEQLQAVLSMLTDNGLEIRSQRPIPFSLEDSFIGIVQRAGGASEV